MKKLLSLVLIAVLAIGCVASFSSCGKNKIVIAVPNDTTNEARALALLDVLGYITLQSGDVTATVRNVENPYDIEFREVEAAQLPNVLQDVDYAVINSNYAIPAKITPITTEGTDVSYPNIICVKDGNQTNDLTKALVAAVNSEAVKQAIADSYSGAIVCDLKNVTNGFDNTVNYEALAGQTIKIAASPTPHADILKAAKTLLATKNITLDIIEYTDYVQPNLVVESGECYANYFQHVPYLNDFNAENNTHIVSVLEVHHEPMGIYSAKYNDLAKLDALKNK